MERIEKENDGLVQLARLALSARQQDVQLFIRRLAKTYSATDPDLAAALLDLLRESPTRSSPLRKNGTAPVPVDVDTRLQLIRVETTPRLGVQPILRDPVYSALQQLLNERIHRNRLESQGLYPTRTALFTGPSGVGKTLAARWLASQLDCPLLILDLSAVMSSFLGRTGNNLRYVLDYAKEFDCILLLDELDAIAKRRDDTTEIGELKRLVTVLLQEVDDWPPGGLLIAATNHPNLLDPAVWRRFERIVEFPLPDSVAIAEAIDVYLGTATTGGDVLRKTLAVLLRGRSFSDIERSITQIRRSAALSGKPIEDSLSQLIEEQVRSLSRAERIDLAHELSQFNYFTQRQIHELTGVSRDTIRKNNRLKDHKQSGEALKNA